MKIKNQDLAYSNEILVITIPVGYSLGCESFGKKYNSKNNFTFDFEEQGLVYMTDHGLGYYENCYLSEAELPYLFGVHCPGKVEDEGMLFLFSPQKSLIVSPKKGLLAEMDCEEI